jgi:hypothetical protein
MTFAGGLLIVAMFSHSSENRCNICDRLVKPERQNNPLYFAILSDGFYRCETSLGTQIWHKGIIAMI